VTPVQTDSIGLTQTDWNTATRSLQGQNPLAFSQFDSRLGPLQAVNITMTFTTREVASMTFVTPSTTILRSSLPQTPDVGTRVTLGGPTNGPATTLLTGQAPVFTYTRTYGFQPGQPLPQTFSTQFQPGNDLFLTPDQQRGNTTNSFTGTRTLTITDPSRLALFLGTGTIGLPAMATGGATFVNTSGNGSGRIETFAGVTVSLSYTYVPEPSSVALLGLGGGGLLLAGGFRRRRLVA